LSDGLSTGLFVDQRENRAWLRRSAAGARVLNLFCYTGSFTAAAALGGAAETVSVDLSRRALDGVRRNLELNGVAGPQHHLVKEDVLRWLERARRRGEQFDCVVLDPPTFGTRARGAFTVAKDYRRVAADAMALLDPGGRMLAVTNHRKTSLAAFRKLLHGAAADAGRAFRLRDVPSPWDCPDGPDGPLPSKAVLILPKEGVS
jgi:23S rRNA (cytosine1962-C5)-methyltransferase